MNEVLGPADIGKSVFSDPRWRIESDPGIQRVRVTTTVDSATLRYVAPTGAACKVAVGLTAPATSNDIGDPSDTPGGREHSFLATGLTSGAYRYRISCPPARALGTFTIQ